MFARLKICVMLTMHFASDSCINLEGNMMFRALATCVFILGLLLGWSNSARAEWSELTKEPEAQYFFDKEDRKSTRLNSSHVSESRMPSSA